MKEDFRRAFSSFQLETGKGAKNQILLVHSLFFNLRLKAQSYFEEKR
jgi:hypothetical protein